MVRRKTFILESVVARELLERNFAKVYYFRNKEEVDFVILKEKEIILLVLSYDLFDHVEIGEFQIEVLPVWHWLLYKI